MAQTGNQAVLNIDRLLTLSVQSLDNYFFRAPKEKARKLYKEIAGGDVVRVGALKFQEDGLEPVTVKLALDHSEYRGHLTFHIFKTALGATLKNIAERLQEKKDLNVFTSEETGEILIHLPGAIRDKNHGEINVMVVGFVPALQTVTIKLQFLDPDQFRRSPEEEEGTARAEDPGNSASDNV